MWLLGEICDVELLLLLAGSEAAHYFVAEVFVNILCNPRRRPKQTASARILILWVSQLL